MDLGDRNTEIWSTRLKREITALESSDDESKKIELLPPFIKNIGHSLNTDVGLAKIEFRIEVELPEVATNHAVLTSAQEAVEKKDVSDGAAKEGDESGVEDGVGDAAKKVDESGVGDGVGDEKVEKAEGAADVEGAKGGQESEANEAQPKEVVTTEIGEAKEGAGITDPHVILVLDASLYWKPDSSSQSTNPLCYPFQKPLAIIKSGADLFSGGSTVTNGDEVDIDLDWTPSIHLSDAVTNVALKIRECVKRGEPLHPAKREESEEGDEDGLSGSILREAREARESIMETKKAMGAMFSSGLTSLSAKGSSIAAKSQSARGSVSKGFLSLGESLAKLGEDIVEEVAPKEEAGQKEVDPKEEVKRVVKPIPDIGDEIDLSEEPWNRCTGMYSCKAIKRPAFVEDAIFNAQKNQKDAKESSSASSMFTRFAQSAKSVMEESFLLITEKCIIEFKSNRLNIGSGTVSFAINIDRMAKLKFRREESLSLFFKQATDDPLVYMCLDSALAVQDIQSVLKRHGVKGKHTNAATQRAVQMALNLVALIQQKEKDLIDNPTVDRVNEIMDLYRQAAEKFESAGDPRHTEVMAHMKRFLGQQFTTSILDGSFAKLKMSKKIEAKKGVAPVPQGEILEQPTYNLSNDDDDDVDDVDVTPKATGKKEAPIENTLVEREDPTLQNLDDILNDAVKDMSDLGMENDHINNILSSPLKRSPSKETDDLKEHDDAFAELESMFGDADRELNELLNS